MIGLLDTHNGALAALSPRGLKLSQFWTEIVAQASNYEAPTTILCRRRLGKRDPTSLVAFISDAER